MSTDTPTPENGFLLRRPTWHVSKRRVFVTGDFIAVVSSGDISFEQYVANARDIRLPSNKGYPIFQQHNTLTQILTMFRAFGGHELTFELGDDALPRLTESSKAELVAQRANPMKPN